MASKFHIPNPLDYVDGKALGKHLRSNPTPSAKMPKQKPIRLATGKRTLKKKSNIPSGKV